MRLDAAGLRTWLLAALAGWAVATWLLAVAGMGSRIAPLPDDPALAQTLPEPRPPAPERLGALAQYAEIGARPLFSTDRKPQPFTLQAEGEAAPEQTFDYVLTGVLLTPSLRMAIVQPAGGGDSLRLKVGDTLEPLPSWRLVALNPRSAVFAGPDGEQALDLRSYDGTGGAAPTALRAVAGEEPPEAVMESAGPVVSEADQGSVVQAPQRPPAPPAPADPPAEPVQTPEAQMDAIRKRIEARRAQLRREAQQQQQPPAKTR